MSGNFDFLTAEFPALATFGNQAERYCKDDSNSALIKVGMIGESIVDMIYGFTGVEEPADQKAVTKINRLASEGNLPQQIVSVLHPMQGLLEPYSPSRLLLRCNRVRRTLPGTLHVRNERAALPKAIRDQVRHLVTRPSRSVERAETATRLAATAGAHEDATGRH